MRSKRQWCAEAAAQDATEGERLALAYIREVTAIAERMDADSERFSNRGAWNRAQYLLLTDFVDALERQIGHWRRVAAQEAAKDSEASQ